MVEKKIRDYMKEHGIKASFIFFRTNMSKGQVYASLAGQRKLKLEEYIDICKALGVEPGYFLGGD